MLRIVCGLALNFTFPLSKNQMNTSFEKSKQTKVEWLTPPELVRKLGKFDLDPCAPANAPFYHADEYYTLEDNGLSKIWNGRIYLNPPYGKGMELWIEKLKHHGNGIALIFARTETKCFFDHIWNHANAMLFIKGRIRFYHLSGHQGGTPGAPSILIAYGKENAIALENSGITGKLLYLK